MKIEIVKKFKFICLSITLTTVNFLDSSQGTQTRKSSTFSNEDEQLNDSISYYIQIAQERDIQKEFKRMFREYDNDKTSKSISYEPHSTKKYGPAASMLDRCQEFLELSRQEAIKLDKISSEIDKMSILNSPALLNGINILERKRKLESHITNFDKTIKR